VEAYQHTLQYRKFFLDKFVKIASALGALPPAPLVFGIWGSASDSCLLLLYTITTFYKATVLVIKRFINVEKNKLRLFFYSNSALFFVGGSAKILFAPGAVYPS